MDKGKNSDMRTVPASRSQKLNVVRGMDNSGDIGVNYNTAFTGRSMKGGTANLSHSIPPSSAKRGNTSAGK